MLICLINIAVKYVGILGQLLGRGTARPETLEARALGQANEFGGSRQINTDSTDLNTGLLSSVLIIYLIYFLY